VLKVCGFRRHYKYFNLFVNSFCVFSGTLISDSEVVAVVFDIIHEIPWLRNKACTVRVGHTKLMTGVLLHHGVDEKLHSQIIKILADVKVCMMKRLLSFCFRFKLTCVSCSALG